MLLAGLAAGGVALYAQTLEAGDWRRRLTFSTRIVFGLALLVFGLSHFVYLAFTAQMVPAWLPWLLALMGAAVLLCVVLAWQSLSRQQSLERELVRRQEASQTEATEARLAAALAPRGSAPT